MCYAYYESFSGKYSLKSLEIQKKAVPLQP